MSDRVMKQSWFIRLKHKNQVDELLCERCGKPIHVGDEIHTNSNSQNHGLVKNLRPLKIYHMKCWESLFIEC